jgi:hypothetical protein
MTAEAICSMSYEVRDFKNLQRGRSMWPVRWGVATAR